MTCRLEGGVRYNQVFDAENRLSVVQIMNTGVNCPAADTESTSVSATTRFYYDGQGNQVKRLDPDTSYTLYFFGMDEVRVGSNGIQSGESIYYPAGGAMRVNGVLKFILSDHLGSTSVVTNDSGAELGRMGYYPFGKTRYTIGSLSTDKLFTGQQLVAGIGLYNYKARWYDAYLNRWIQPDTIIPDGNPQSLNRFSYVNNSPINHNDPSGHSPECIIGGEGGCLWWAGLTGTNAAAGLELFDNDTDANLAMYEITAGGLAESDKQTFGQATMFSANKSYGEGGFVSANAAFRATHGKISVNVGAGLGPDNGNCETTYGNAGSTINCHAPMDLGNALHEIFHVFDKRYQDLSTTDEQCDPALGGCSASNYLPGEYINDVSGFHCTSFACIAHPPSSPGYDYTEAFANIGQNWILDGLNIDPAHFGFESNATGNAYRNWMDYWMPIFFKNMGLR